MPDKDPIDNLHEEINRAVEHLADLMRQAKAQADDVKTQGRAERKRHLRVIKDGTLAALAATGAGIVVLSEKVGVKGAAVAILAIAGVAAAAIWLMPDAPQEPPVAVPTPATPTGAAPTPTPPPSTPQPDSPEPQPESEPGTQQESEADEPEPENQVVNFEPAETPQQSAPPQGEPPQTAPPQGGDTSGGEPTGPPPSEPPRSDPPVNQRDCLLEVNAQPTAEVCVL